MKKWIVSIAVALLIFLLLSWLCYLELDSLNLVRAGLELSRLVWGDTQVVQIGQWPKEVWLSRDYETYAEHLTAQGWELLTCEQMGSRIPVEKDGVRAYVYWSVNGWFHKWTWEPDVVQSQQEFTAPMKPVIYLYPQTTTDVTVRVDYTGGLSCTYPAYEDGWRITAHPDGTLTDERGREYYCLYWEGGETPGWPMEEGFCVAGQDTAAFLEEALDTLGLSHREANEFLIYWLPQMEDNPWNLISFQTDAYTDAARLDITPAPDTLIRVFMTFRPLSAPVEIEPQILTAPERLGFTAVEWGGGRID